jgi:hypothetical protein
MTLGPSNQNKLGILLQSGDGRYYTEWPDGDKPIGILPRFSFNPGVGEAGGQAIYQGSFLFSDASVGGGFGPIYTENQRLSLGSSSNTFFASLNSDGAGGTGRLSEYTIPALSTSTDVNALPLAAAAQSAAVDIRDATDKPPTSSNGLTIRGMSYDAGSDTLIVGASGYYDTSGHTGNVVLVRGASDLSTATIDGMIHMEGAGRNGVWHYELPPAYQATLGKTHIAGAGYYGAISSRLSIGPSQWAYDLSDLLAASATQSVSANALSDYPHESGKTYDWDNGTYADPTDALYSNPSYNMLTRGATHLLIPGTRTAMWIGMNWDGVGGVEYQSGVGNVPINGGGFQHHYMLFDLDDLVEAYDNPNIEAWDLLAYESGVFTPDAFPFAPTPEDNDGEITGAFLKQVDANTVDLYCSIGNMGHSRQNQSNPGVSVFRLNVGVV